MLAGLFRKDYTIIKSVAQKERFGYDKYKHIPFPLL